MGLLPSKPCDEVSSRLRVKASTPKPYDRIRLGRASIPAGAIQFHQPPLEIKRLGSRPKGLNMLVEMLECLLLVVLNLVRQVQLWTWLGNNEMVSHYVTPHSLGRAYLHPATTGGDQQ